MLQPLPGCELVSEEEAAGKPPETSVAGPSSLEKGFGESSYLQGCRFCHIQRGDRYPQATR